MSKILTISISAYNIAKYLEKNLDIFAKLSDRRIEVLIVDDGSTDDTNKIVQSYIKESPDIFKYIYKNNGGWGSTINKSIPLATGKYFKQLDGDDLFNYDDMPAFLEYLYNCTTDIVLTSYSTFIDGSKGQKRICTVSKNIFQLREYDMDDINKINPSVEMHNITVKTSILKRNYEDIKLKENCFYTDVEYVIKVLNISNSFIILPCNIYMYRLGRKGQSVSIQGIRNHYAEHRIVLEKCLLYMKNYIKGDNMHLYISGKLTQMAMNQYAFYLCLPISINVKRELIIYDEWLRKEYPNIKVENSNIVKFLRLTRFYTYMLVAIYENIIKK